MGQSWPAQLHKLGTWRASRQQRTTPEQDAGTHITFYVMALSSVCSSSKYFTVTLQGNCVVMYHENWQKKTGMWASRACEMESHGFICQRQQGLIITYYYDSVIKKCYNKNYMLVNYHIWLQTKGSLRLRLSFLPPCLSPWSWGGWRIE